MITLKKALALQKRSDKEMKFYGNIARKIDPASTDPVDCLLKSTYGRSVELDNDIDKIVDLLRAAKNK